MNRKNSLILGDILVIGILTAIGFASHGETGISFLPRMGTTFFPLTLSWFLLAPWFGLFEKGVAAGLKQIWRVPLVMLFAAPLCVILRAFLLGSAALPLFTLILGSTFAFGMLIWRLAYGFTVRRLPDQAP